MLFFPNQKQVKTPAGLSLQACLLLAQSLLQHFVVRRDVYAVRWIAKKTGRKGYSPSCKNSWNRDAGCVRKIRHDAGQPLEKACKDCRAKDYQPLTKEVVLNHLLGRHCVGIYLLEPDRNTCVVGAIDLDDHAADNSKAKKMATQEVDDPSRAPLPTGARIVDAARSVGLEAFLERSGGGHGSHVWVFFAKPMPAEIARRLLISLAVKVGLGPKECEVFPKQDEVGDDGLGNLIALPFQGPDAVADSRSVFYDSDELLPIAPIYTVLKTISESKISEQEVARALEVMGNKEAPHSRKRPMASCRPAGETRSTGATGTTGTTGLSDFIAPDAIDRIFAGCAALRVIRDGDGGGKHRLSHDERLVLASVLRGLPGGREELHRIIGGCPDYDEQTTNMHIDSLKHPPAACKKLIDMGLCEHDAEVKCDAMKARGGKSPVAFGYLKGDLGLVVPGKKMKGREEIFNSNAPSPYVPRHRKPRRVDVDTSTKKRRAPLALRKSRRKSPLEK